jgi:hypothetical protein
MPDIKKIKSLAWVPIWGEFEISEAQITFKGYTMKKPEPAKSDVPTVSQPETPPDPISGVGRITSDRRLSDGTISVDIEFSGVDQFTTAEIMLDNNPVTGEMFTVGLGAAKNLISIRHWGRHGSNRAEQTSLVNDSPRLSWSVLRGDGNRSMLRAGLSYRLEVTVQGSNLTVKLDGVEVGSGVLPFQLTGKQVGLFCQGASDIKFRNFTVEAIRPLAFVVMQFTPPEYEELFNDVIVPVCDSMGLEPFRASQAFYPGLIIADIQRQIRDSRVVIAEITPANPNVYYEVGFADAIGKPVILIADGNKTEQLPFDVRAFRTLFYENSIGGKNKVERALREFLVNIMNQKV